jgi:AraC family transcriptional regulator
MATLDYGQTFGTVVAGHADAATLSVHCPNERLPSHEHASAYICVVLSGGFRETRRSLEADRRAGEIIVHPSGERHADAFGPDGALCLNLHLGTAPAQPLSRRADPELASAIHQLASEVARGPVSDRLDAEALSVEIIHRLTRAQTAAQPSGGVERVLQALDDDPAKDWSLSQLAEVAGRHPAHLARAFRRRTGLTLGAYRRRRRLTALCLDLRLGRGPLSQLALDHGYADQAHMSREFRRFAGASPAAWRRQAR